MELVGKCACAQRKQHTKGYVAGTRSGASPFVCTHGTHVAETVDQLVHRKRTLFCFYAVVGTICEGSAHKWDMEKLVPVS